MLLLLLRQRCLTTAAVDRRADTTVGDQLSNRQYCNTVCKLDTGKTDVEQKRVQRSDGHFDLLGMQIFLYKGQTLLRDLPIFVLFCILVFRQKIKRFGFIRCLI